MAISGFTPINALPAAQLAAMGQPIGGAPLPGTPFSASAALGVQEKPGIFTRLRNAMSSAISELRGIPSGQVQTLPLQAPTVGPVAARPKPKAAAGPAKFPGAKTWKDKAGNVRQLGTGKILKAAPKPAGAAAVAPAGTPATPVAGSQLPANAAQLPGATVYSYDQFGNPVAPTMQQLGMTPTMLQGLEGMAGAADPDGPQVNATNQSNVGLGTGLGMGTAVPVLGQPIHTTAPTPASAGAATTGGSQTVHNANTTDVASRNQGIGGYGYGDGGWGLPFGGVATPAAPYGASMLGAGSRLF